MKVEFKEVRVSTRSKYELVDVTQEVEGFVRESGVKKGLCLVFAPHATAAIVANENEQGLIRDMLHKARSDYPEDGGWLHNRIDDNAHAHLASAFIGQARAFPVMEGRLLRGTWQNLFVLELDGPRSRRVVVEVLGE